MAIRIDTQDLENYPGTVKVVTMDQDSIVPTGEEGDEKYVLSFSTTAYSDNTNNTAIQTIYITDFKTGWCKSSGFTGLNSRFPLDSTHNKLRVKIDATVSGTDGSGWYDITLDHDNGTYLEAEVVAQDMEDKIRAIADSIHAADTGFTLSYKNASVEWSGSRFKIISGSVGKYYTGTNRSSVQVTAGTTNDCSAMLGFDLTINSEDLSSVSLKETVLSSDYTADSPTLSVLGSSGWVSAGDCLMITDGTNTDYFTAISGTTDTSIVVPTMATHNYTGIAHSYSYSPAISGTGTKVQLLREQDPKNEPGLYYSNADDLMRFGIKSIVNQVDYSS